MIRPLVTFRLVRDGADHGWSTLRDIDALFDTDLAAMPAEAARRVRVDAGVCGWWYSAPSDAWFPPGDPGAWFEYWSRPQAQEYRDE